MKQYKQGFKSQSSINLSHQYNTGILDGIPIHTIKKINEKIIPIGKYRLVYASYYCLEFLHKKQLFNLEFLYEFVY